LRKPDESELSERSCYRRKDFSKKFNRVFKTREK